MSTNARAQITVNVTIKLRTKPVVLKAAVEHDLKGAEESRHQQKADDIKSGLLLRVRFVRRQQDGDQRDRGEADRTVDQEAPAPSEIIGEPAAERRTHHRRHDHGDAEQRKRLTALLRREGVGQNRLRYRHHAAARQALQNAEQEERVEIPGLSAQDRANAEKPETDQEEGLATKQAG